VILLEVFLKYFFGYFLRFLVLGGFHRQKIKGAVKQGIDWVDTMIARKSIMPDVV